MPKSKQPKTQSKAVRSRIFDKRLYVVAGAMATVVSALAYFREDLPMLHFSSAGPHLTVRSIPNGFILIPYENGVCRLNAIDNATGHIVDGGLVNCADASDRNSAAWKSLADQLKATEIRKSFRHE